MPSRGEAVVARARALVGVRFVSQGRDPAGGLDCVGLVAAALGREAAPRDYVLRGGCGRRLATELAAAGLREISAEAPGDVLVMRVGPGQLHLGVWTGDGLVHADAGLRRVVERPGVPPWAVVSVWREGEPSAGESGRRAGLRPAQPERISKSG